MKFGKNLQKVVDISDPEWAPYWTNYKMLKKLIKELPTLVPADERPKPESAPSSPPIPPARIVSTSKDDNDTISPINDDSTTHKRRPRSNSEPSRAEPNQKGAVKAMGRSPGEIAFFKLLHSEFKKSCIFFKNAEEEIAIREARVQEGNDIMQCPNSIMVNDRWSLLSKSLYRLYKDLLLLETYAIMTYVTFSKILKKHDKMTGFVTRNAFMGNVVSKANFTTYPKLTAMINRTEALYEEVSARIRQEGKDSLYEDERLFINMIHRLNNQALCNEDGPPTRPRSGEEKRPSIANDSLCDAAASLHSNKPIPPKAPKSSLQTLVKDNDDDKADVGVSDDADSKCANQSKKKRIAIRRDDAEKRQRLA